LRPREVRLGLAGSTVLPHLYLFNFGNANTLKRDGFREIPARWDGGCRLPCAGCGEWAK